MCTFLTPPKIKKLINLKIKINFIIHKIVKKLVFK